MAGCTFNSFEKRHAWREQFESMRLLYVAATRAQDRLILSGTTKDLDKLETQKRYLAELDLAVAGTAGSQRRAGVVELAHGRAAAS